MTTSAEIRNLVEKYQDLKGELRHIQHQLTDALVNYEGSVKDALIEGIIKPNFATDRGYKFFLQNERSGQFK